MINRLIFIFTSVYILLIFAVNINAYDTQIISGKLCVDKNSVPNYYYIKYDNQNIKKAYYKELVKFFKNDLKDNLNIPVIDHTKYGFHTSINKINCLNWSNINSELGKEFKFMVVDGFMFWPEGKIVFCVKIVQPVGQTTKVFIAKKAYLLHASIGRIYLQPK
ncbi:MAG: hypothetical protein GY756_21690 [bacterium]|nr:hypothetical protein [bacterium]